MFDRLMKRPRALARHRNGPLAEERRRFLVHCADQQMSAHTMRCIASDLLIVAEVLRLADRPGELITRTEIETAADRWTNDRASSATVRRPHRVRIRFTRRAIHWLSYVGRLQPVATVPRPYADYVAEFINYMDQECGYSPQTIEQRRWTIDKFLAQIKAAGRRLDKLTVPQMDDVLAKTIRDKGFARKTIRTRVSAIRSFIHYAERRGWCRSGLAAAIMTPRMYAYEGLPFVLSWKDVNRVIAAAQGDQRADIRDRALLLLLAVYGLRSGEVAALRLENFDWEQEILIVPCGKRRQPRTYPLCHRVGNAVLRYLREARPRSDRREVFLTLTAPLRPMLSGAIGTVVSKRLHALELSLPHYGSHTFRHACASHLLAQGLSLKEIGDHLGHASPQTTRIYAKVDLVGLREVGEFNLEDVL